MLDFNCVKMGDSLSFDLQGGRIKIVAVVLSVFTQNERRTIAFDTHNFGENTFLISSTHPKLWKASYNLMDLGIAENIQIVQQ